MISSIVKILMDSLGNLITSTDIGSGKRALDVNIGGPNVITSGSSLIYGKLDEDQSITTETLIYENTAGSNGSKVYFIHLVFNDADTDVRIEVDGSDIFDFNTLELRANYELEAVYQKPRGVYVSSGGKVLTLEFPEASVYSVSLKIYATNSGKQLSRGIVLKADIPV